ncbi:exodeoxyribonuclease III [Solitalea canadensis]|uniref:Exodeoxyribonuclease III n=1 Tax=Solitalea canadensis (strain ATCC 29591 / DSM 3403 / JCM 21819 / LMG 8368 / NBRC 15130 / NCIMB 12057 / USAM 9D) TaxID=929556 RepID=H8KMP7_SOLCM|nr:exodeoxyribonuclease III [Solitalea canadensis]AFD09038.1 exodeoxyribonuclease III [Solitalea canadensis DSM 3403]
MRIISYNVNGIRSAISKGWLNWLQATDADVVCLQEIKAHPENIPEEITLLEDMGYKYQYWYPAQKKGYSGVAILSRIQPESVEFGCGHEQYDFEGRVVRADFPNVSVMSVYLPSGSSGEERQGIKFEFMKFFMEYATQTRWKYPKLIISGDYNICHRPIDIHNPKSNANSSGFLPEEREWMEKFINAGFIDTFRHFNQEPHNYTWWSFRANSRAKNLGWRIDYHMATKELEMELKRATILPDARHSDHCPILVEI